MASVPGLASVQVALAIHLFLPANTYSRMEPMTCLCYWTPHVAVKTYNRTITVRWFGLTPVPTYKRPPSAPFPLANPPYMHFALLSSANKHRPQRSPNAKKTVQTAATGPQKALLKRSQKKKKNTQKRHNILQNGHCIVQRGQKMPPRGQNVETTKNRSKVLQSFIKSHNSIQNLFRILPDTPIHCTLS